MSVKLIEINGITKRQAEWARELGITREAFRQRVAKGLVGPDLLSIKRSGSPLGSRYLTSKYLRRFGLTLRDMKELTGIGETVILYRINQLDRNPQFKKLLKLLLSERGIKNETSNNDATNG